LEYSNAGVMEYWRVGVLASWNQSLKDEQLFRITPLLQPDCSRLLEGTPFAPV